MKSNKGRLTAAYLHSDGHAVLLFEKRIHLGTMAATTVQYAEVYEKWTEAQLLFTGRIVLHRYHAAAYLKLAKIAQWVKCEIPALDRGSDKTKAAGLHYGDLQFGIDGDSVCIPTFSDGRTFEQDCHHSICSNGYSYQPHWEACFEKAIASTQWSDAPIAKIHRVKHDAEPVPA